MWPCDQAPPSVLKATDVTFFYVFTSCGDESLTVWVLDKFFSMGLLCRTHHYMGEAG